MDINTVKSNFEKHDFEFSYFETVAEANAYLDSKIDGKTIGIGGSKTLDEMNILNILSKHNTVLFRFTGERPPVDIMKDALTADIFITSANGVSETGEIVNIDGNCNRIAAEFYGHEKVYIVVGINKIQPTFEKALWRARNIAAPKNAQRFGRKTPCAVKADRCYDCTSPERICRGLAVLWRKPSNDCPYEIVVINQELGF